jgi:hypothetical protein
MQNMQNIQGIPVVPAVRVVHVTISLRLRGPRTAVTALHCLLLSFHATILCSTAPIVRPKR